MSDEIGTYTFLPFLRQGLANQVSAPSDLEAKRGKITVTLNVTGTGLTNPGSLPVEKQVEIYGPGDIIGIDPKAIVKTEPLNWITNFEPNYLPYIDFYDEDFLWRYTPAAADGERLIPWLSLVVFSEDEFIEGKNILNKPLNYITLTETTETSVVFPPEADLWAWAHVHINKNIGGTGDNPISSNETQFINQFKSVLSDNPDHAYSRIMSSRKLGGDGAYHAFLMPTFEAGRLAGLGIDPTTVSGYGANTIAWAEYMGRQETKSFPYYYRWFFRTGSVGDFEYLVRLLQPRVADSRVGRRDMDVQEPGSNIDGIDDARLAGILRLGGALQVPTACLNEEEFADHQNYDQWIDSYPHPFQQQIAVFINLADDYTSKTTADAHTASGLTIEDENPNDPDPLITPPLYGRWHALTSRLLTRPNGTPSPNNQNWVHELNLDPRWRTSANYGTTVIQDKQEEYMDAAWSQVGDVLEANRRLRWSRFAGFTSRIWYKKNLLPRPGVAMEHYLELTTPLQKRILSGGKTVYYNVRSSLVPQALISAPMRRITRPRGRLLRRMPFTAQQRQDNFIERVNLGEVTPAPPREIPDNLLAHEDVIDSVKPGNVSGGFLDWLERHPEIVYLPWLLALILIIWLLGSALLTGGSLLAVIVVIGVAAAALFNYLRNLHRNREDAQSILPEQQTPASVDALPASPDFRVTEFGDDFVAQAGETDTAEAVRFKTALRASFDFVQRSAEAGRPPSYTTLDVSRAVNDIAFNINPALTIPRYTAGHIRIPPRLADALVENFVEAMAYPEIDIPMYRPLLDLSTEHFVPNINLIEQNSITLLETNQRFIESYMVGLNHEFARELLWREYPTDQRGSYFRQFWDVSSYLNKEGLDEAALREKLRDIPPLHRWSRRSNLGDHDHRETGGEIEEEVVLVVRGELLKKYPTAVIYAHRAEWATDEAGNRVLSEPRDFADGPVEEVIKTPLYEAKVDPDIYFFGFDLTVVEAKGGSGENDEDEAGWFFVIKERPGEPRFGLDVPGDASDTSVTSLTGWNELAWSHVMSEVTAGKYLTINGTRTISVLDPGTPGGDEEQQQKEDSFVTWRDTMNAAELAYILYQVPVLMGVHAAEMLPDKCTNVDEE